jgi:hypothetical protein
MDAIDEWCKRAALFPALHPLAAKIEHVAASSVPQPYKALLLHKDHMTAVMERFHKSRVEVQVLARRIDENVYSREILLLKKDTGAVVQFAFAQFSLGNVPEAVEREILSEEVPLGRALINHRVQCDIEVNAILKVTIGRGLSDLLRVPKNQITYGRIARILCNRRPTFHVIEISSPTDSEYISRS